MVSAKQPLSGGLQLGKIELYPMFLERNRRAIEKHGTKLYLAQVGAARQRLLG